MDYYQVLGVSRSATKEEIKNAFRKLAVRYHPDKHSQTSDAIRDHATVRFKQVSEAYEVLIDDTRRAHYNDRLSSSSSSYSSSSSSSHYSTWKSRRSKGYGYRYEYTYKNNGSSSLWQIMRGRRLSFTRIGILFGLYWLYTREESKPNNSGESFEEAGESVEKAKELKHA
ncbi:hypothetical protein SLE2022_236900 [Rubroshorea leprosula]